MSASKQMRCTGKLSVSRRGRRPQKRRNGKKENKNKSLLMSQMGSRSASLKNLDVVAHAISPGNNAISLGCLSSVGDQETGGMDLVIMVMFVGED